jgi:hypothetical protein
MGASASPSPSSATQTSIRPWLVGVLITIASAFFSTVGLLLQKYAHMKEARKLEQSNGAKGYKKCLGIPCNIYFVSGFFILTFVPLPLDFIALSNAGQSLIIPVGTGMTIIWSQILSPLVLKERFDRSDISATAVIVIGVLVSTLFGTHSSPVYTAEEIISFFGRTEFIVLQFFVFFTVVISLVCIHTPAKLRANQKVQLLATGYAPAIFGSTQIMFFKVVGELNKNTFEGIPAVHTFLVNQTEHTSTKTHYVNEFLSWKIYIFTVCVILFAVLQFTYMNRGLSQHDAVKYLPIYNTFLLLTSVIIGSIFFNELESFHPFAFPLGCCCLVIGIHQLARRQMLRIVPLEEIGHISQERATEDDNEQNTIIKSADNLGSMGKNQCVDFEFPILENNSIQITSNNHYRSK